MLIAITINTTWNIYNFRMGLIETLQKYGHTVVAIAPKDLYTEKLSSFGVKHFNIDIDQGGTNPFKDYKIIKDYKLLLQKIKPDLILSFTIKPNIYGNLAAKSLNIPVINNISGLGTLFIKKSIFSLIGKILYRYSLSHSSKVFFQNEDDQNLFIRSSLVSASKAMVIPGSGVNLKKFSIKRTTNQGRKYLFVGRLIGDKGIYEYLNAANEILKSHHEIEFYIVGELGYKNKTAISEKNLQKYLQNRNIKYLGKQDDMVKVLSDVDVIVLPSYREGLSKSLIEAASMSLPIITTNVPGCRDVVKQGINGFYCEPRNVKDLKTQILKMINLSPKARIEMGKEGRKIAKHRFDETIIIEYYLKEINKIFPSN